MVLCRLVLKTPTLIFTNTFLKMSSAIYYNSQHQQCNSLVFFDLETTGLPNYQNPRITELSFCAVDRLTFLQGKPKDIPRVTNRLNLCIYPSRPIDVVASEKTLLYTDMLEYQSPFNNDVANIISSFLDRLNKPICLIAHNGNRFDFPILKSEIDRLGKVIITSHHFFSLLEQFSLHYFPLNFFSRNSRTGCCALIRYPFSKDWKRPLILLEA